MNRITQAFNRKAFIPFITCGDPDLETTERLAIALAENGADLIEIGIPFSDPTAEGPTIQAANNRALTGGTTTDKVFKTVANIRKSTNIPMVFMTYANVVFSYGIERFIQKAAACGIDGLILPDVPFEEREEFDIVCKQYNLVLISMIAPTSNERAITIAQNAEGFLYCVSSLGVTGSRNHLDTSELQKTLSIIKETTKTPCAIGFGISTPEQAGQIAKIADGVIIGSAIIKLIEAGKESCLPKVINYAKQIRNAIDKASL